MTREPAAERVLTVPNLLSLLRLLGVGGFVYLAVFQRANGWALLVLALAGLSDWADGAIARRFGLTSRLGTLLDPAADRFYIVATVAALTDLRVLPLWLAVVLVARDAVLAATLPLLWRRGYGLALPVNAIGKAGTLSLLYAFPLLLLTTDHGTVADVARPIGWAFTVWGIALYWWAGGLYLRQLRHLPRRPDPAAQRADH